MTIRICLFASLIFVLLAGCSVQPPREACPAGTQDLPGCPPLSAVADDEIDEIYELRTWVEPDQLEIDPVEYGKEYKIPVQQARIKFIGPSDQSALDSLAAKLWMIENAKYTLDLGYYIYKADLVGKALAGALCNAVRRGVDVRILVDSAGSISGKTHPSLRAVQSCAENAGFMRNAAGETTNRQARVQFVVFNAVTKLGNPNRRSHDKVIIMDGAFEDRSVVMTGGRNISVDYYGIDNNGQPANDAYRDAEILLRSHPGVTEAEPTVGEMTSGYFSLLFLMPGNKPQSPGRSEGEAQKYWQERKSAQEALQLLKGHEHFSPTYAGMSQFMNSDYHVTPARFAHELGNLTDRSVTTDVERNNAANPNSIMAILRRADDEGADFRHVRIVSPYLFLGEYKDKEGNLVRDEAVEFRKWIDQHPDTTLEIVTNSVLTSDNFPAQSVIDMETAPRLLLSPEMREQWLGLKSAEEATSELVSSKEWKALVNHPRVKVWETGRSDSNKLGGEKAYGKLHAKFLFTELFGFVGTANFDYRSRLYNNEMGFFFSNPELIEDLLESFEDLVDMSYQWGSPEWLEMRQQVMNLKGSKGHSTRAQRSWYRFLSKTGIIWLL